MNYNKNSVCRKCGGNHISTNYNSQRDSMVRKCITCGYSWDENPLDSSGGIEIITGEGEVIKVTPYVKGEQK